MHRLLLVSIVLATISCGRTPVNDFYRSMPAEVQGWRAQPADDQRYDRQSLYSYIDGGAELYLTYRFKEAFVRRFVHPDHPGLEIVLDIYDMTTPDEAFGIFSSEREDESIGVGQDSEYGGGLLRFWKGHYFVSMVSVGEADITQTAMLELARLVADRIEAGGTEPALVSFLPREGRQVRDTRYFHAVQSLNNRYFVATDNILNLSPQTTGVLAAYEQDEASGLLLLVQYAGDADARRAYDQFTATYMPEARDTGAAVMENGTWTVARVSGRFVMIVFEAPEEAWASRLLSGVTIKEGPRQ